MIRMPLDLSRLINSEALKKLFIKKYANVPTEGIQKMQLLFVDNNARNNSYDLSKEIKFSGLTAEEALNKISNKQIATDVVVANAKLGFSQIKNLRKITEQRNLPLILYTSDFDQKIKDVSLKLGVDDYFYGSMLYTFASRIKFIKQVRELRVRWLKQESEHKHKKDEGAGRGQLLKRRMVDVIVSLIALILSLPIILLIAIAREIESMADHIFSNSKNTRLMDKVFNWYEFLVLILFSPIFLIITVPLKIGSKEEFVFSSSKRVGLGGRVFKNYKFKTELTHPYRADKNRSTLLGVFLIKTGLVRLPQLMNVLKGDISFFGDRPIDLSEARDVRVTGDQHANQFSTDLDITELRQAH